MPVILFITNDFNTFQTQENAKIAFLEIKIYRKQTVRKLKDKSKSQGDEKVLNSYFTIKYISRKHQCIQVNMKVIFLIQQSNTRHDIA